MKDISLVKVLPVEPKVPFISMRVIAAGLSILLIIASILLFATKNLNYGIDFTGGVVAEMDFKEQPPLDIRSTVSDLGFDGATVQNIDPPGSGTVNYQYVRVGLKLQTEDVDVESEAKSEEFVDPQQAALSRLTEGLQEKYGDQVERRSQETVSGKVSGELRKKGLLAVLSALVMIMAYIAFRFEWQFAIGAVAALVHDVLLTIGVFSLTGIEFNLSIIAAILTIVGYSLNDTVIVYDRIRENLRKYKKMPLPEVLNLSINDTLSRTILTSMTTLLALISLYVLGGDGLRGFSFAMIWGVIVGTYSSIFVASPLLLLLKLKRGGNTGGVPKEA